MASRILKLRRPDVCVVCGTSIEAGSEAFRLRERRRSRGDPPRGWTRPRLRFDPAIVRERWASVNALPAETRTRRRRPTTKLHAVPTIELLEFESED